MRAELLKLWRENHLPVFYIQHCSSNPASLLYATNAGNAFNNLVLPAAGELIIKKKVNSAFIVTLVIVGLTTDHCISTTTRMAGNLGYETYLVADATATFNKIGVDGTSYSAELIHETALVSLHKEFATIVTTGFIKQSILSSLIIK
ncbi:isochorismatase family protein [Ferruginibacter sp.]